MESLDVLKKVYQNAKTANDAIDILIVKSQNPEFLKTLLSQQQKYLKIKEKATGVIVENFGEIPKEKILSRLLLLADVGLLRGDTTQIAKTLINGSAEGILDIKTAIEISKNQGEMGLELALSLIDLENENIRIMQGYLK